MGFKVQRNGKIDWRYLLTAFKMSPFTYLTRIFLHSQYKLLNNSLPLNIHLLTLEHWRKDQVLLRIEHIFEKDEDRFLSLPETINLQVSIYQTCIVKIIFSKRVKICLNSIYCSSLFGDLYFDENNY